MAAVPLLLVCDFNAHGGTQTQVLELARAIDRASYRPVLCTPNLDPALSDRMRDLDVPIRNLGLRGAFHPRTFQALSGLVRFVREQGVRVIHGFLLTGNLVAAFTGRRAGVEYLTSVRNLELWKRPHQILASRWAHSRAAAVTFNSRHVRDLVAPRESIPLERTRVIYNGAAPATPPDHGSWPAGASPRLICAASLFPKKGHRHLLDAFVLLRARHPGAVLMLAGQGPERPALQERARDLGLEGSVIFAGYRPDARDLIAASDLIVLSSIEEGMPNVLIEAMAAGVPQVATSVGGTPETMEEGVTGFLVPPRDPVLMAERIDRVLLDGALRARMSAASQERFARLFSLGRMAREHESLYDAILGARR